MGERDEIIRIKTPKNRSKWIEKNEGINKQEIQELYLTRWDIEISIREVKTIMDINILRSKTHEMSIQEITVSLATYNLLRRAIYSSIKDLPLFPKEDFIHKFYTLNQDIILLLTKRGEYIIDVNGSSKS